MTDETIKKLDDFFETFPDGHKPLLLLGLRRDPGALSRGSLQGAAMDRRARSHWQDPATGADAHGRHHRAAGEGDRPAAARQSAGHRTHAGSVGPARRRAPPSRRAARTGRGAAGNPAPARTSCASTCGTTTLAAQFEDKPNAAVMHWRGASPRTAKFIEMRTRELFEPLSKLPRASRCSRSKAGWNCASAATRAAPSRALVGEVPSRARPSRIVGDDLTDEAAFIAVNQAHGPAPQRAHAS